MKISYLLLVVILIIPLSGIAGTSPHVKISEIIAEGNENGSAFIVVFETAIGVGASEGTCAGRYHYLNASTEKGKLMFSMLLTAKSQNKTVRAILTQAGSANRCIVSGLRY